MNPFPPSQNSFFVPIISKGFRNEKLQLESISSPTAIKLCIVFFCCKNATFSSLGEFFYFRVFAGAYSTTTAMATKTSLKK